MAGAGAGGGVVMYIGQVLIIMSDGGEYGNGGGVKMVGC